MAIPANAGEPRLKTPVATSSSEIRETTRRAKCAGDR